MIKVTFQKGIYDDDGDLYEDCLILWLNDIFAIRLESVHQIDDLILSLQRVSHEVLNG